jgi:hypothetical protein
MGNTVGRNGPCDSPRGYGNAMLPGHLRVSADTARSRVGTSMRHDAPW